MPGSAGITSLLKNNPEDGRVRGVSVDPADQRCGPCQYFRHVGTMLGRGPQFHATGHARRNTGPENKQFCCRTHVLHWASSH